MSTKRRSVTSIEDRTAELLLPDSQACVKIIEILYPFSLVERELIMSVVAANKSYPRCPANARVTKVVMPEPVASIREIRQAWSAASAPKKRGRK